MERTFSSDARAVVPTTQGLTSAIPNAGSINTKPTSNHSGTAARTGASHDEPSEPNRKYEPLKMKYASESDRRKPKRSANVPPNAARTNTRPPNKPVKLLACAAGKLSVSCKYRASDANAA